MARNPTEDVLREVSLFSRCTTREIKALARLCTTVTVAPVTELTRQGRTGDQFFVLLTGEAEVVKDGDLIATLGAGDPVGELALIDRQPRSATVTTATEVTALVMSAVEFRSALSISPGMDQGLLLHITDQLRRSHPVATLAA
jgi:CRP/FNR family cyclic AMP-dependent transcriptional regulator